MNQDPTDNSGPKLWLWLPAAAAALAAGVALLGVYAAARCWFIFSLAWLARAALGILEARGRRRALHRLAAHALGALLMLGWTAAFALRNKTLLLEEAAAAGNEPLVRALVKVGADVNRAAASPYCPLTRATAAGDNSMVRLLLKSGADPNVSDDFFGITPLMAAAIAKNAEAAQLLLSAGAEVNARDNSRKTALIRAAEGNTAGIIRLLLAAHADAAAQDVAGKTAADYASDPECLEALKTFSPQKRQEKHAHTQDAESPPQPAGGGSDSEPD